MTVVRTARERARRELIAAIKASGAAQLAEVGASSLSLRAVARDLGVASSALYRYFPSRDALLTALIVDAYDEVGEVAERADAGCSGQDPGRRWLEVCRAVRAWARAKPHSYALLYGSPVPGYQAPQDTIGPAIRLSRVMAAIIGNAVRTGCLQVPRRPVPHLVTDTVLEVAGGRPSEPYGDALERALVLLLALVGALTYELFGHLENVVTDKAGWFDAAMAVAGEGVGLIVPVASSP